MRGQHVCPMFGRVCTVSVLLCITMLRCPSLSTICRPCCCGLNMCDGGSMWPHVHENQQVRTNAADELSTSKSWAGAVVCACAGCVCSCACMHASWPHLRSSARSASIVLGYEDSTSRAPCGTAAVRVSSTGEAVHRRAWWRGCDRKAVHAVRFLEAVRVHPANKRTEQLMRERLPCVTDRLPATHTTAKVHLIDRKYTRHPPRPWCRTAPSHCPGSLAHT